MPWGEGKWVWPSPPWVQFSLDKAVLPWEPMAAGGRPARALVRRRILERGDPRMSPSLYRSS